MTRTTTTAHAATADTPPYSAESTRLAVEYWTVTMDGQSSCGSCDETRTVVDGAIEAVRPLAARLGIHLDVLPRTVATWAEAIDHGIVASPTIRAAGHELRPVHPDTSGSRVWRWRDQQTDSLAEEAALDLLLRALVARSTQIGEYLEHGGPSAYVRRFLSDQPAPQPTADTPCGAAAGCS
ncbi:hypothetical protein V1J52_11490 [Streptomyces sp. TRM 70351]|uniref:hypothetical protein n=1 Tax=Streptomyces sp. TRM 70351 TaxID=3116552 RepID=UPI002E7B8923|nr:hypothetical protein [Streptomyces sp. TRM 70351]MEE1928803.1 hypothetical protein [Streptomyces sp. TRM 70351]